MARERHLPDEQHGELHCFSDVYPYAKAYLQSYKEQSRNLAGQIAFLKMQSTRFAGEIADDAVNIFGGRGLTKTGELVFPYFSGPTLFM
jgi:alkylation response protein AidB-like acyl-CoA dehydrogenase